MALKIGKYEVFDTHVIDTTSGVKHKRLWWGGMTVDQVLRRKTLAIALKGRGWTFKDEEVGGMTTAVAYAPPGLLGMIWWKWLLIIIVLILLWWFGPKIIAFLKGLIKR